MELDLSTGTPASPDRTRHLTETFAELARTINHTTMDHGAFGSPDDADRALGEYLTVVERIPQFLAQLSRWVTAGAEAGRIEVPSGQYAGRPDAAATALLIRIDCARASLEQASADLKSAARVTSALAAREDGTDD